MRTSLSKCMRMRELRGSNLTMLSVVGYPPLVLYSRYSFILLLIIIQCYVVVVVVVVASVQQQAVHETDSIWNKRFSQEKNVRFDSVVAR